MIRCGFVVAKRRRSQGQTIILSLQLCLVTIRYIRQLLGRRQSVTKHRLCRIILPPITPTPSDPAIRDMTRVIEKTGLVFRYEILESLAKIQTNII
jgi:hypothetical protein